jgi:hypothetical protein
LAAATVAACGGTGTNSALQDAGGDAGHSDAGALADATATPTPDGALSTASASACFPDGASTDTAASLGASCVPLSEESTQFTGFAPGEVSVETGTLPCGGGACLVNHFQGRVTCPNGQSGPGQGLDGAPACLAPGTCGAVAVEVQPQCANRPASQSVYCSCRCANVDGRTDDGATYCTCPITMACVQLVAGIGNADRIAGAYCIKAGTEYGADAACP